MPPNSMSSPPYPAPWPLTDRSVLDVAVIGAGQSGLAILHGLKLAGIDNVGLFDAAAEGEQGVWQSVARMRTLRTDKTVTGPEHGNPSLSFEVWIDQFNGVGSFAALERIPRLVWQQYLNWFATQIGAKPSWRHLLTQVGPGPEGLALQFATPDGVSRVQARHLVIASGMDGFGSAYVPETLRRTIPPDRLWHTQDRIPDEVLSGKRLLVVGTSASAFDIAASALESGAAEVHQIGRSDTLEQAPHVGADLRDVIAAQAMFYGLDDHAKWQAVLRQRARGSAPVQSIARAGAFANHRLHLNRPASDVGFDGAAITLGIGGHTFAFDHVICGTGYRHGAELRPEFSALAPLIRTWRDLDLPVAAEQAHWGSLPYLGAGFELQPKAPEQAWLSRIHVFTFAAILSHGLHVGDICSARVTVPRLVSHLSRSLFEAERDRHESIALGAASHFAASRKPAGHAPSTRTNP